MKRKIDKIIAVAGFGLLGYYFGLSIFRSTVLQLLIKALPAINGRNLPTFYTGLLGAGLAVPFGFLAYTLFFEKRSFAEYKRQYIAGVISLLLLPLLVAASFRVHAVSIVRQAESTIPTEINIQLHEYKITFMQSESSGIVYGRHIQLKKGAAALEEIGSAVRQLSLKNVTVNTNPTETDVMFMQYTPRGKWYSKIMTHSEGVFSESVSSQRYAMYEGEALESIMQGLVTQVKDINQYTQGSKTNAAWMSDSEDGRKPLSEQEFRDLISLIKSENKVSPGAETIEYFNKLLKDGVTRNNEDVYGIYLTNDPASAIKLENFMIYSEKSGLLWYEGEYFKAVK
ncbi:MAG: hypothetical protein K0R84_2332 [Clostridia bacterium]|jgi:hypothetical protein|nr:hypothetical protein [Clostridia bacterium]